MPVPDAGAPLAAERTPEAKPLPPARPEPPPIAPIDPKTRLQSISFLAANDKQSLMLTLPPGDEAPSYVVFDLATRCAVESYREASVLRTINKAVGPLVMETYYGKLSPPDAAPLDPAMLAALNDAEGTAEISRTLGLASRFGLTSLEYTPLAWNAEGPHVLVVAGLLYHSSDGGRTFRAVDDHPASSAKISPDGKTVVYERCTEREAIPGRPVCRGQRELVASPLATLDTRAPVPLTPLTNVDGYVFPEGFSKDGHVLVWRTDAVHGCMLFIDPSTAAVDRNVCVTDPHFTKRHAGKPTGAPELVKWQGLSPDEGTGSLHWQGFQMTSLTYETAIVDMKAGAIQRTLTDWQLRWLGDNFTAFVQPWSAGDAQFISAPGKPLKLVHRGFVFDWDPITGRAIVDTTSTRVTRTLGATACKLLSVRTLR